MMLRCKETPDEHHPCCYSGPKFRSLDTTGLDHPVLRFFLIVLWLSHFRSLPCRLKVFLTITYTWSHKLTSWWQQCPVVWRVDEIYSNDSLYYPLETWCWM